MALHRALEADWQKVDPVNYSVWQRWAVASHGWLTPGNIITASGFLIASAGLIFIATKSYLIGISLIVIGRVLDVLDGYVADLTKTKSPLGEALDATVDKVVMCLGLLIFLVFHSLPLAITILLLIHTLVNIGLFSWSRKRGIRLHPSQLGKLAAVNGWLLIATALAYEFLQSKDLAGAHLLLIFSYILLGLFILSGGISSYGYFGELKN